jgi:hypothetical protein
MRTSLLLVPTYGTIISTNLALGGSLKEINLFHVVNLLRSNAGYASFRTSPAQETCP